MVLETLPLSQSLGFMDASLALSFLSSRELGGSVVKRDLGLGLQTSCLCFKVVRIQACLPPHLTFPLTFRVLRPSSGSVTIDDQYAWRAEDHRG